MNNLESGKHPSKILISPDGFPDIAMMISLILNQIMI